MPDKELRFTCTELRVTKDGRLSGYAAVYNSNSVEIPGVGIERILPGAFDRSVEDAEAGQQDLTLLANHNEKYMLGSVVMGNLKVSTDDRGLKFEAGKLPDVDYARAVVDAVREKRMNGCSFSFNAVKERRAADGARELMDVDLFHLTVCPPNVAAYRAAGAEARAEFRTVGEYVDPQAPAPKAEKRAVKHLVTETDGTQHLPVTGSDGKPDHHLMGAAWAALHGGYRGNKYQGPDKDKAIAKLKSMYKSEGTEPPSERGIEGSDESNEELRAQLALEKKLHKDDAAQAKQRESDLQTKLAAAEKRGGDLETDLQEHRVLRNTAEANAAQVKEQSAKVPGLEHSVSELRMANTELQIENTGLKNRLTRLDGVEDRLTEERMKRADAEAQVASLKPQTERVPQLEASLSEERMKRADAEAQLPTLKAQVARIPELENALATERKEKRDAESKAEEAGEKGEKLEADNKLMARTLRTIKQNLLVHKEHRSASDTAADNAMAECDRGMMYGNYSY